MNRWFILNREGLPMQGWELPDRPAEAHAADGDEFRPWFKTTGHLHVEDKIVGIHSPATSLESLQERLAMYLRHEHALLSHFGSAEDIELSEADAFLTR